jgi:hypothetical protein
MIITHGKPEVDDDTGLITYEDIAEMNMPLTGIKLFR